MRFLVHTSSNKKRSSSSVSGKDEERHLLNKMRLSWYHLHSLVSYNINLVLGSPPTGPITEATGRVLLSHQAISSRSFGVFFTVGSYAGFPPLARSLDTTRNCYSSLQGFCSMRLLLYWSVYNI